MKKYSFSVIEYGIMNEEYKGYRGARIEVEDNYSDSPYPVVYEASILIPEEFYDRFVEVFDGQESDLMPRIIWDYEEE